MKAAGRDWKEVQLGSILRYLDERVEMEDEKEYFTITVKRRHGGLEIREKLFGHQIATKKQFRLVPGAFIISRVQCWHHAYAIVPNVSPNTIASINYDQFEILSEVDPRFFWWLSHSPEFTETIRSSAVGVVIEKMVFDREDWLTKSVRLPSLAEQRRVVARIEELAAQIHEARTLRQQATEEAKALRSAARSTFFTSATKDHGASRLEDLSTRVTKGESPEWQGFGYQDSGPLFIRSENVLWGSIDPRNAVHIPQEFHEKLSRSQLRKNDVLINLVGASIGRASAVPGDLGDANVNQAVGVISPSTEKLLPAFLVHFLLSPIAQDVIHGGKVETARPNISLGDVRDLEIPTPPLAEQHRIVAELDALQAEVDVLRRMQAESAAELDALLPAILDRAFKGEL